MRRQTYIAHPLGTGEDRERNRLRAMLWVAWAALEGANPVATWVTLAGVWPETPEFRSKGLEIDLELIECCTEVWLVGGRISHGMSIEAAKARQHGIKVVDLTHLGAFPPGHDRATRSTDPAPSDEDDRITVVDVGKLSGGTVSAPEHERTEGE